MFYFLKEKAYFIIYFYIFVNLPANKKALEKN